MTTSCDSYKKIDLELVEKIKKTKNDASVDFDNEKTLKWSCEASQICPSEKWEIPFAVGGSNYLPCHFSCKNPSELENLHDILEVPIVISKESDYSKYAHQIIDILFQPHNRKWNNMKWNFDSSIKYMNLILYIPDLTMGLHSDEIMIPKTAIPILGNTLHELISRTKAWVFTGGSSLPICDMIGEGVWKANLQEKSLVQGLKKRLEMTGIISKYTEGVNESIEDRPSSRYHLHPQYCKELSDSLSPFSNLHLILRHCCPCTEQLLYEKLLYNIGVVLRVPTLKLSPRTNHENLLIGFDVDFIDPYRAEEIERTPQFYNIVQVQRNLYRVILSKADDFFHRNEDPYTGWNIMTMAIFLNDNERVGRAFMKSNFVRLEDEFQVERIFRYVLVYGSQPVVQAVFEDESLSKLLMQRYKKILELTFNKSSNEVFLYNRLMIALKIVDDRGRKRREYNGLELMELSIQSLMSHGFLWVPPVKLFHNEEIDHLYAFFPEYIMLWGVLSQRFEVVELFLMYSGLHLQYSSNNPYYMSTQKGIFQICNALAISCMFKGVAKRLKGDTSVTRSDFDKLIEQSKHFDHIATELLDHAITSDDTSLRNLLNTPSPFWSNKTALELASIGKAYKFMNHHAVSIYLQHVWRGYDALRQEEGDRVHIPERVAYSITHPYKRSSLRVLYLLSNTPRTGYFLHGLYFLFMIVCAIVLLAVPSPQETSDFFTTVQPLEWVLFVCLLGFTIEEVRQYVRYVLVNFTTVGLSKWRIVLKLSFYEYFDSLWNKMDIIIILTFLASILIRLFSLFYPNFPIYITRLFYGFTAIPLFIRCFQYILVIKAIGPLIYTIYQGFLKMLKFLLIILILSLAVGTLQIALLRPTISPSVRFRHLIFTPFFQIFGEYFFDELLSDTYLLSDSNMTNLTANALDGIFWARSDWLLFLAVAIWVLIINVLILNLMIAYFTQIYEEVAENSRSIYILQFIEIVEEFRTRIILPPPLNLLFIPIRLVQYCQFLRRTRSNQTPANNLLQLIGKKRILSNKVNVYFATHYENSFADKFWKTRMQ